MHLMHHIGHRKPGTFRALDLLREVDMAVERKVDFGTLATSRLAIQPLDSFRPGYSVRKRASNDIGNGAWRWNSLRSSTRRTYQYFYSTLEFFAVHRSLYSIQKTSHRFVIALIAVHLRTISSTLSSHKTCKSIADWRQDIARGHQVADIRLEVFIVGGFIFVLLEVADPILQRRANLERTEKSIRVSNASKQENYLPYL